MSPEKRPFRTEWSRWTKGMIRRLGYDVVKTTRSGPDGLPLDFDDETRTVFRQVRDFTMTSAERIFALCRAVEHISRLDIAGAVVECGVWRGGSMMAVALTLGRLGDQTRELFLFDTFAGMPAPTSPDVSHMGESAARQWTRVGSDWCRAGLDEVRTNMATTGYSPERIHFVRGRVEETIPGGAPDRIALLRLDTDWYESTRHELLHLYPRLVPGGILIIDDYGYWQGARRAVDEYIREHRLPILLCRIDDTARIAVKSGP